MMANIIHAYFPHQESWSDLCHVLDEIIIITTPHLQLDETSWWMIAVVKEKCFATIIINFVNRIQTSRLEVLVVHKFKVCKCRLQFCIFTSVITIVIFSVYIFVWAKSKHDKKALHKIMNDIFVKRQCILNVNIFPSQNGNESFQTKSLVRTNSRGRRLPCCAGMIQSMQMFTIDV